MKAIAISDIKSTFNRLVMLRKVKIASDCCLATGTKLRPPLLLRFRVRPLALVGFAAHPVALLALALESSVLLLACGQCLTTAGGSMLRGSIEGRVG